MRRFSVLVAIVVLAAVSALGLATTSTVAQEGTPTTTTTHPVVGAWIVDSTSEDPSDKPAVAVITADGTLIDNQGVAGTWQATGPRTAATTIVVFPGEGEAGPSVVIRGTIEVDEAGETWTGPYSFTIVGADGMVLGSGRNTAVATRVPVEPVEAEGTPLVAIPTWMPATQEATPTP